ncbi:ribonuclease HII [Paenibacillaceae bacterium]|nr:ribonuclease HII [Paenibacillaceae bacterium]
MLTYEMAAWEQGYRRIAGVDEVGRGCLFGDVVAAAVIMPEGLIVEGIDDSKKLTAKKREQLYETIVEQAVWAVARIDASVIDSINIKQASRLAMKQALLALDEQADYALVDAEKIEIDVPQLAIIHGDALSQSIAAASIIAKVTRDRLCEQEWDAMYPEYGIAVHKGYATKLHRERLLEFGPSPLHRRSFLKKLFAEQEQMLLF